MTEKSKASKENTAQILNIFKECISTIYLKLSLAAAGISQVRVLITTRQCWKYNASGVSPVMLHLAVAF